LFIFPLLLSKLSFLPRVCGSAASACHWVTVQYSIWALTIFVWNIWLWAVI
jgi:hypothetical protein